MAAVAATALALAPAPALAAFTDVATRGGSTFSAATLAPPTSLAGTPTASFVGCTVQLSWTASASAYRTGYVLQRFRVGAPDGPERTIAAADTSYVDTVGVLASQTYAYELRTTAGSAWRSTPATATVAVSGLCT